MPKILFVCYGGGHVSSCLPVADVLKNRGWDVQFLALTTASSYLRARGWPYLTYTDFVNHDDEAALKIGKSLLGATKNPTIPEAESIAYLGINFSELIDSHGAPKAAELYQEIGRQAFLPVNFLRRVINQISPDVIYTTCSPRSEQAAILAGIELSVPTVCLLDLPDLVMARRTAGIKGISKIFAFNQSCASLLLEHGAEKSAIQITGNPAFDSLSSADAQAHAKQIRSQLLALGKTRLVVWASQIEPALHPSSGTVGDPKLPAKIELRLRDWVKGRTDTALIIRHHPNESTSFEPGTNVFHSKSTDSLAALLNACDLVVTMTSTVALEAKAIGKSVVTVDLSIFTPDMPLAAMGISTGITDLAALGPTIDLELQDKSHRLIQHDDFKAAPIIVRALEDMVCRH